MVQIIQYLETLAYELHTYDPLDNVNVGECVPVGPLRE